MNLVEKQEADVSADFIFRIAEMSIRQEEARSDSLSAASSKLLTGTSILSGALIALLGFSYSFFEPSSTRNAVIVLFAFDFALLAAAFILLLLAQKRTSYRTFANPKTLSDFFRTIEPFANGVDAALYFCESVEVPYDSLRKKNDRARKLIDWTSILLIAMVATTSVIGIIFLTIIF